MKNQKRPKKHFTQKLAEKLQSEHKEQVQFRSRLLASLTSEALNFLLLFISAGLITIAWYLRIAKPYLQASQTFGGLIFKDLTFAKFITLYHPFPPTSWLPFWNAGVPLIGGYPSLFFYLILPFTLSLDYVTGLQIASLILILLFLIASLLLFFKYCQNVFVAAALTFILLLAPATYFTLVVKGEALKASVELFLPLTLLILTFFQNNKHPFLLALASLTSAIVLLIHPLVGILKVLVPATIFLFFSYQKDNDSFSPISNLRSLITRVKTVFAFLATAAVIAIPTIFPLLTSNLRLTSDGPCSHPLCWGTYPQDLRWFSPILLLPISVFFLPAVVLSIKHRRSLSRILKTMLLATGVSTLYLLAAKLKVINFLTSELPPQEIYSTITFLLLAVLAISFHTIKQINEKLSTATAATFLIGLVLFLPFFSNTLTFTINQITPGSATIPIGIETYILEKYKTHPSSEIIPDWLTTSDPNWRVESIRSDFYSWWNSYSNSPSTRGSANLPNQKQQDWLFFLQDSLLPPTPDDKTPEVLRQARSLYLLDAYAIRYLHQSVESPLQDFVYFDPTLLDSQDLIIQEKKIKNWTFSEVNPNLITPIVTPTNAQRLLIVSDQSGYDTLLRAITYLNLNSSKLIPFPGPQSINSLRATYLANFDAIILYQFTGTNWSVLENFINQGGSIFVDIGSLERSLDQLPEIPGIQELQLFDQETSWSLTNLDSQLTKNVVLSQFAPLRYGKDPWKIIAPSHAGILEDWLKPVLLQNNRPILLEGNLGKGKFIYSGFNLPYHIVSYKNAEEVKLFGNILEKVSNLQKGEGLNLQRVSPEGEGSTLKEFSRPNPSSISLQLTNAKGIFFKENFHPGWKAQLNGKNTKIFKAGFDFMYIPIPQPDQSQAQITIKFQGDIFTWGLPLLSILAAIITIVLSLAPKSNLFLQSLVKSKLSSPLKKWWSEE